MVSTFAKLKDGLKDGLSKLTGGGTDASQSAVVRKCEECVAEGLFSTDWQQINELCTLVNDGDVR